MRAVVVTGPGEVRVDDVARPEPRGADAVVEVSLAAICASDLHLLDGHTPGLRAGAVIGHEFVGTVASTGAAVARHRPGDRVVGSFLVACGACAACAARRFNHCERRRALGLGELAGDLDGAQAEYVRVPGADVNLRAIPPGVPDDAAVFAGDVLATGLYAASLAEGGAGDVVAVVGGGPVGLMSAAAARRAGASVVVLDTDERRVDLARERLGVAAALPGDDPAAAVAAAAGRPADAAIEAVGAVPAFKTALRCVRDGGRVVVVGVYGAQRYELPMGRVWVRALDLRFSGWANVQAHWDDALDALARREIDPARIVTHRLPLDDAPEGYELFRTRRATKVVLEP